jgi:3',5'-cyclic AMP phosphodiesterase CpdA
MRTCSSSWDGALTAAQVGWSVVTRDGRRPTLWAISDLHTGHTGNKPVTESLHPSTPDDWLIVAGDVAERTDEIHWSLDLLRKRFAKVIWVPGNHELWTTNRDPMQIFGKARYDYLVNMCDEMGIITPEHPFPVWTEAGGPATIVPMFLLYDYTFLPQGAATKAEGLAIARERNVVGTDEFLLSSEPYATRDAWCRNRVAYTRKRLEDLDWMTPTVLVNHFPLVREPCDAMFYPEFSLWCGTTATADWHTRYNAICSVYGHLHIPRTTWYDDVRFEEVSVGYPREWRRRKPYRWLRQVLPDPKYAPGYLNEFGGHFEITQEMRDHAEKVQQRIQSRQS